MYHFDPALILTLIPALLPALIPTLIPALIPVLIPTLSLILFLIICLDLIFSLSTLSGNHSDAFYVVNHVPTSCTLFSPV